jgi:hypothetical protein
VRRHGARDEQRRNIRSEKNDNGSNEAAEFPGRETLWAGRVIHLNESSRLMAMSQNLPNSLKVS